MISMLIQSTIVILFLACLQHVSSQGDYGVDCSFPIHSKDFKCGDLLGDRETLYNDYMDGCREEYKDKPFTCDETEDARIEMSVRQPQSMVNYTSTGFKKIKAPENVIKLLNKHWDLNKDKRKREEWPKGNIYVNHWSSPTYLVSVEDETLEGVEGKKLKNMIWDAAKSTIEEWTGMEQKPTSMYGIRIYTEGAILSPHVDRLPLVGSCIVNVAQDVDEDWPLEVIDREGKAVNVTMEPGDMVLYESGSLIHGRPFALKGRYYANIFIHFEPTGRVLGDDSSDYQKELEKDFYPPYIMPGSPEMKNWRSRNPHGWKQQSPSAAQVDTPLGHLAARQGDIGKLARIFVESKNSLSLKDRNGWQPIHEAARHGQKDAVELLVGYGVDINARTHRGKGGTPLNIALAYNDENHPVAKYLMSLGAVNLGPEL